MKPWLKVLIIMALLLTGLELLLRVTWGFGRLPLYYASAKYEYALRPGQSMTRFGSDFHINEAGMRSAPLSGNRAESPKGIRILKLGDSVLNGGLATAQSALASTLLEEELQAQFPEKDIRVLNISAGSWGPDNALAWVREHGTFGAKAIVLVFSSHDWRDCMEFKAVVGNVPFYPEQQPRTALSDAFTWLRSRYLSPVRWQDIPSMEGAPPAAPCDTGPNPGWPGWSQFCRERNLPLLVYHHPTKAEWTQGSYNAEGQALQAWLEVHQVACISGLDAPYTAQSWRDDIHPNPQGQAAIAQALQPALEALIQQMP